MAAERMLAEFCVLLLLLLHGPAAAAAPAERLTVGIGQSVAIALIEDARDVILSNPAVAEVVLRSPRTAFLIGQKLGRASVTFLGADGRPIRSVSVSVERDLAPARALIARLLPGARVRVASADDSIVLSGTVAAAADASAAAEIAARFAGGPEKVLNLIATRQGEQVLLKVVVAEVARTALRRVGLDMKRLASTGGSAAFAMQPAFPLTSGAGAASLVGGVLHPAAGGAALALSGTLSAIRATAILDALETSGELRVLAEPSLASVSGETANFLSGGEFPVPVGGKGENAQPTVQFKPFGVALAFTPLVLDKNRISLKISTEVSELSAESRVVSGGIAIPGLKVRRASATLEVAQGQALVLAGLTAQTARATREWLPGLADMPLLGDLFGGRERESSQSELIVIVMPHLVEGVTPNRLRLPGGAPLVPPPGAAGAP